MEGLSSNDPWVIIAVAVISSATTIVVNLISNKVAKKVQTRPPKTVGGYERLFSYLEDQLTKKDAELKEIRDLLEKTRGALELEREERRKIEALSTQRRVRLLELSREYGADVADLV